MWFERPRDAAFRLAMNRLDEHDVDDREADEHGRDGHGKRHAKHRTKESDDNRHQLRSEADILTTEDRANVLPSQDYRIAGILTT
jgi:hypothetical protein